MGSSKETTLDPDRPFSKATEASGRLLAVYEIGRQLLEQREPDQVIRTIQQAIVEQLRPDHACVLAVTSDGSYRPLAVHNLDLGSPFEQWPLSRTVLSRARDDGLAVLVLDSRSDPRFEGARSVKRFRMHSAICVPLGRSPVHGLVYVDNRSQRPFTRDDLDFVTAVSLYASRVLERAEEHLRTAEALRRTDERLSLLQAELLRHEIVGRSPALLGAYDALRRFARSGARVLLRGETGTGKELFARAYAASSPRSGGPYVPVPIPALAPGLIESELFGHVRGAFTEASRDKKGRLELADGGVLFLDEVGDIEPALQPKLLRFLDSGELHRVGDTEARFIDALVVSATNRALESVGDGRFRPDLLARLGHVVTIPPLRERAEDIPLLLDHFLSVFDRRPQRKAFAEETVALLQQYPWPLNVRELRQVVERAVCLVDRDMVLPEDLPDYLHQPRPQTAIAAKAEGEPAALPPLHEVVARAERDHILKALEATKGNKRRAIELLRVSSETFYRKLDEFGIRKKDA